MGILNFRNSLLHSVSSDEVRKSSSHELSAPPLNTGGLQSMVKSDTDKTCLSLYAGPRDSTCTVLPMISSTPSSIASPSWKSGYSWTQMFKCGLGRPAVLAQSESGLDVAAGRTGAMPLIHAQGPTASISPSTSSSSSYVLPSAFPPASSPATHRMPNVPAIPQTTNPDSAAATVDEASYQQIPTSGVPHCPRSYFSNFESAISREGEFVCGWGAAFINICVTFPLNKAIFRQQLHGISGLRAIQQLHQDGLRYLYRGLLPPLLQKTTSLSIMFGAYYRCQDLLHAVAPSLSQVQNHALAAMMSGTLEAMLAPFERIQTLMQTRRYHNMFANTVDAFHGLRSYGFGEYYRGMTIVLLRNGPSNVCFFLGREYLQALHPHCTSQSEKLLRNFLSGACLGALISTFFFPFNVVKTHMQCQLGGPFDSLWLTFRNVLREGDGSARRLFKGATLNCTRSFLSWGIINASYEFLMGTFFRKDDCLD